jgi:hypothetical protein
MSDFISDDEMSKLEAAGAVKTPAVDDEIISDADMQKMEAKASIPSRMDGIKEFGKDLVSTGVNTGETLLDGSKGVASGMTLGLADEIGGGISAGLDHAVEGISGLIPGTDAHKLKELGIEGPSLLEKYRMYQENGEKEFDKAAENSPITNTVGSLAGSLASGTIAGKAAGVFGGAAKTAKPVTDIWKNQGKLKAAGEIIKRGSVNFAKASPLMAVESLGNSKHDIIGEELGSDEQINALKNVGNDLAYGLPAIVGMQAVGDLVAPAAKAGANKVKNFVGDMVEDSDFAQQMKIMNEYGEQGINPVARKNKVKLGSGEEGLIRRETSRAQGLMDEVLAADESLGKDVGASLHRAEQSGLKLNLDPVVDKSFQSLSKAYDMMEAIGEDARGRKIFNTIATRSSQPVSPSEAKMVLDDVDAFINKFKSAGTRDVVQQTILDNLIVFRKNLSNEMKTAIPEYGKAAGRFEEFRRLVPETIIAGDVPQDVSGVYMGSLKNPEKAMLNKMKAITKGSTSTGSADDSIKEALENHIQGLNKWEAAEAARGVKNPLPRSASDYAKVIREYANDAAARRSATTVAEAKSIVTAATGFGQASRSMTLGAANLAGRTGATKAVRSAGQFARHVYNLPADKLSKSADKLLLNPKTKHLGTALQKALANPDQSNRNAVLFTIMQNPESSIIFDVDDEEGN